MLKIYNDKDEKNTARRLRRQQGKQNNSPEYLEELKANRARRKRNRKKYNKTARNLKNTDPQKWEKRLAAGRKYKTDHQKEIAQYEKDNRRKRQDQENTRRRQNKVQREALLLLLSAADRKIFIAHEKAQKTAAEKKKLLAKKEQEFIKSILPVYRNIEDKQIFKMACDKAIETINKKRESRIRRNALNKIPYIQRCLQAIIDYYDFINETELAQAA